MATPKKIDLIAEIEKLKAENKKLREENEMLRKELEDKKTEITLIPMKGDAIPSKIHEFGTPVPLAPTGAPIAGQPPK